MRIRKASHPILFTTDTHVIASPVSVHPLSFVPEPSETGSTDPLPLDECTNIPSLSLYHAPLHSTAPLSPSFRNGRRAGPFSNGIHGGSKREPKQCLWMNGEDEKRMDRSFAKMLFVVPIQTKAFPAAIRSLADTASGLATPPASGARGYGSTDPELRASSPFSRIRIGIGGVAGRSGRERGWTDLQRASDIPPA